MGRAKSNSGLHKKELGPENIRTEKNKRDRLEPPFKLDVRQQGMEVHRPLLFSVPVEFMSLGGRVGQKRPAPLTHLHVWRALGQASVHTRSKKSGSWDTIIAAPSLSQVLQPKRKSRAASRDAQTGREALPKGGQFWKIPPGNGVQVSFWLPCLQGVHQ